MKVLALSSSRSANSAYLQPAIPFLKKMFGAKSLHFIFIPFASVGGYDQYCNKVAEGLKDFPFTIELIDKNDPVSSLKACDGVMVGGGNTFKLLHDLYEFDLVEILKNKVKAGLPYIGWSAGSNILGPSISTTNDMPIIQPESFSALQIFPFQINPHYYNQSLPGFNGETRDQRIEEFLSLNNDGKVIALPEGSALIATNDHISYHGKDAGFRFSIFQKNLKKVLLTDGETLTI